MEWIGETPQSNKKFNYLKELHSLAQFVDWPFQDIKNL